MNNDGGKKLSSSIAVGFFPFLTDTHVLYRYADRLGKKKNSLHVFDVPLQHIYINMLHNNEARAREHISATWICNFPLSQFTCSVDAKGLHCVALFVWIFYFVHFICFHLSSFYRFAGIEHIQININTANTNYIYILIFSIEPFRYVLLSFVRSPISITFRMPTTHLQHTHVRHLVCEWRQPFPNQKIHSFVFHSFDALNRRLLSALTLDELKNRVSHLPNIRYLRIYIM